MDPSNTAVVVFVLVRPPAAALALFFESAVRPSGSSFGNVDTISPPSDDSVQPRVVIDPKGVATATFSPFTTDAQILITRRPAGGTFGGVQPISPTPGSAFFPAMSVDNEGNVVIGWTFRSAATGNPYTAQVSAMMPLRPT